MSIPDLIKEVFFRTSRSSGSGGQHVNKVSTKAELNFDVQKSSYLSDGEKQIILQKLSSRINEEGVLKITVQSSRSQYQNKQAALEKFKYLLENCFRKQKRRIPTARTFLSKEKRLVRKKRRSEIKKMRGKNFSTE